MRENPNDIDTLRRESWEHGLPGYLQHEGMKLSIITINLNNAAGLRKTLDSVASQIFGDYEHIIIDGASTDASVQIIEEYARKEAQRPEAEGQRPVIWVSEPDKGIYNAMNKGILRAKGEYCFFLNSGDYLVDGEVLGKVFAIPFTEDVVYGFLKFDWGDYLELRTNPREVTLRTFVEGTIYHSGSAFIRREAFNRWGVYDENLKIAGDWKWFLQAVGLGTATTRYIDVMLSVFDCTGISMVQDRLANAEREKILKSLIPERILSDYKMFGSFDKRLHRKELEIRNSMAYRLGYSLLKPLKTICFWSKHG